MSSIPQTVLVLGAGFTKAFVPKAPLLVDNFGGGKLARDFQEFRWASRVLDAETVGRSGRKMNIEQLLTRLDGRMPYDRSHEAESELAHLLTEVRAAFVKRVMGAGAEQVEGDDLARLAQCCVENGINCVTFNSDDVFDQALWKVNPVDGYLGKPHWQPNDGYGFFCRASYNVLESVQLGVDFSASMHLFKLHGSVNWRTRLGTPKPYGLDAVLHDESWYSPSFIDKSLVPHIEGHLDPDRFIVPPVLVKSSLVEEPVLQYVWSQAYKELAKAEQVIFIGYSFPVTDMAARFLFTETLVADRERPDITVINLKSAEDERETVRYRQRLDDLFRRVAAFGQDMELQSHWARYLCVLASGFLETSVRSIYGEYARTKSARYVANYVEGQLKQFHSPKMENILELTRSFSPDWEERLRDAVKGEPKDAVDSIVANRHNIAHGRPVGITYHTIRRYYGNAMKVIELIDDQCSQ